MIKVLLRNVDVTSMIALADWSGKRFILMIQLNVVQQFADWTSNPAVHVRTMNFTERTFRFVTWQKKQIVFNLRNTYLLFHW